MSKHCCPTINARQERRRDPTMTKTLRKKFEAEFYRRLRRIKGRVRELIVKEDAFGLKTNAGRFEFVRPAEKVGGFMSWLRDVQQQELFEVSRGVPQAVAARQEWTSVYLQSAYKSGMAQAANKLRQGGVQVEPSFLNTAFMQPIHADRVGLIYTRAYEELKGITAEMDRQISRVLAEGIAAGENPITIARTINNRIDKIGVTRARMLARTEVISAHAEASLNTYEQAGAEGVEVEAEWATANDDRVCAECEAAARRGPYTIDEARGMIPLHPNCRCAFLPIVVGGSGITLR